MALIAGVLILIMPRLLNFIVAIFLILTGLAGLGCLKMAALLAGSNGFRGLRGTPQNGVRRATSIPLSDCLKAMAKAVAKSKKTA